MSSADRPFDADHDDIGSSGYTSTNNMSERVECFCALICDGAASRDDYLALDSLLTSSRPARRTYLRYMSLHANLCMFSHSESGTLATDGASQDANIGRDGGDSQPRGADRVVSRIRGIAAHPRRRLILSLATSAAVMATLLFVLANVDINRYPNTASRHDEAAPVARITDLDGCQWGTGQVAWRVGQSLRPGDRLDLDRGLAKIQYLRGAQILLEGPLQYQCEGANSGRLEVGRLIATVPARAAGYTIASARMSAVDLGTEFGMQVQKDGQVELHVLEGRVRAELSTQNERPGRVELSVGEALRLNADSTQHERIAANGSQFVRQMATVRSKAAATAPMILVPEFAPATALIPRAPKLANNDLADHWWDESLPSATGWIRGRTGVGYDTKSDELRPLLGLDVRGMFESHGSVWIRIPFDLAVPPDSLRGLQLSMRYDDGFVAFLNGHRVAAANAPVQLDADALATGPRVESHEADAEVFDLSPHIKHLRLGSNLLAIHGLNHQLTSTDLLILPPLTALVDEVALVADEVGAPARK